MLCTGRLELLFDVAGSKFWTVHNLISFALQHSRTSASGLPTGLHQRGLVLAHGAGQHRRVLVQEHRVVFASDVCG